MTNAADEYKCTKYQVVQIALKLKKKKGGCITVFTL